MDVADFLGTDRAGDFLEVGLMEYFFTAWGFVSFLAAAFDVGAFLGAELGRDVPAEAFAALFGLTAFLAGIREVDVFRALFVEPLVLTGILDGDFFFRDFCEVAPLRDPKLDLGTCFDAAFELFLTDADLGRDRSFVADESSLPSFFVTLVFAEKLFMVPLEDLAPFFAATPVEDLKPFRVAVPTFDFAPFFTAGPFTVCALLTLELDFLLELELGRVTFLLFVCARGLLGLLTVPSEDFFIDVDFCELATWLFAGLASGFQTHAVAARRRSSER